MGNTKNVSLRIKWTPVHPHACGEYSYRWSVPRRSIGPSPRVWGIRRRIFLRRAIRWSIPTRVGNTSASSLPATGWAVHPHACGEYVFKKTIVMWLIGPSPRVWGILPYHFPVIHAIWSIPTRVGNTSGSGGKLLRRMVHPHACGEYPERKIKRTIPSVHPHACGEYPDSMGSQFGKRGPSPRVWGILPPASNGPKRYWSIPTRVGNT